MDTKQKNIFLQEEADAWFDRNIISITNFDIKRDPVAAIIKKYHIEYTNCLELGCSAGHRLHGLKSLFPNANYFGIDPSSKAINYGKKNFSNLELSTGTADDLLVYETEKFDLIIIGFLFYVMDRNLLYRAISEIDRVLKNYGFIILVDFHAIKPMRVKYHHINQFDAFSYKQPYDNIFTSSCLYHLIEKNTLSHNNDFHFDSSSDFKNQYSASLLKKNLHIAYE
jgi:ubiquinone/menaquinone biosynthesis C-methylase UbiE